MDPKLLEFFKKHEIVYENYEHPAVFTVEESQEIDAQIPAKHTKNLFLVEKGGENFFLVCVAAEKRLKVNDLRKKLGAKKLTFASAEQLFQELQLTPGSVSLFGLIYADSSRVKLILDQDLWEAEKVGWHPNQNTATTVISQTELKKFLESVEVEYQVWEV